LEFGPTIGFVLVYLVVRNDVFTFGGRSYSGLVAVTAMFMPVFAAAIGLLWALTGRIAPVQDRNRCDAVHFRRAEHLAE
jgi:intracellular septation protein